MSLTAKQEQAEVDALVRILIDAYEKVENGSLRVSFIATFDEMARAAVRQGFYREQENLFDRQVAIYFASEDANGILCVDALDVNDEQWTIDLVAESLAISYPDAIYFAVEKKV